MLRAFGMKICYQGVSLVKIFVVGVGGFELG